MPSRTMASLMIDAASCLLDSRPQSSAFKRRAVSSAYYATFHAMAKLCADYLIETCDRSEPEYERVYRALEHGALKRSFEQSPLRDDGTLRRLGSNFARLQAERFRADYLPPVSEIFSRSDVQELIDLAREVVTEIEAIGHGSAKCRMLAANLLFKDRKQ